MTELPRPDGEGAATTGAALLAEIPHGCIYDAVRALDLLFGRGVDDAPLWLLVVRINVVVFLAAGLAAVGFRLAGRRRALASPSAIVTAAGLTVLAAVLRFGLAVPNLVDFGGIPYSRLLYGYAGHFGTAQFYSIFYQLTSRDIEHAIFFDQIAGTLTIPLVYLMCRNLSSDSRIATVAAFLFAVCPLHILFSASDSLAIFSIFLAAAATALLTWDDWPEESDRLRRLRYLAAFSGLALLTQVRYENALFLIPPAAVLFARRTGLRPRTLLVPALFGALLVAIYGYEAGTSGLTFQNPIWLRRGVAMVVESIVLNPFVSLPVLVAANLGIFRYRGFLWGALSLLPWIPALVLPIAGGSGHGAARVFTSWLILILPFSAYGISLMSSARSKFVRLVAAAFVVYFAAQPMILRQRLASRYLEVREHEFFGAALAAMPPRVELVIVPDDELLRRETHSTIELFHKYEMIRAALPDAARRPRLVGLTDYLEHPERTACAPGRCLFFSGLPCLEQDVYPFAREQCREIERSRAGPMLYESTQRAAPFLDCSIYVGALAARYCRPATRRQHLAFYWIEDAAD